MSPMRPLIYFYLTTFANKIVLNILINAFKYNPGDVESGNTRVNYFGGLYLLGILFSKSKLLFA